MCVTEGWGCLQKRGLRRFRAAVRATIVKQRSEKESVLVAMQTSPSAYAKLRRRSRAASRTPASTQGSVSPAASLASQSPTSGGGGGEQDVEQPRVSLGSRLLHAAESRLALKHLVEAGYGPQVLTLGPGDSFGESTLENETVEEVRRSNNSGSSATLTRKSSIMTDRSSRSTNDVIRTELATLRAMTDVDVIELSAAAFNSIINRDVHLVRPCDAWS